MKQKLGGKLVKYLFMNDNSLFECTLCRFLNSFHFRSGLRHCDISSTSSLQARIKLEHKGQKTLLTWVDTRGILTQNRLKRQLCSLAVATINVKSFLKERTRSGSKVAPRAVAQ